MAFKLKNIDRAIEWVLRDAFIAAGYWPDERAFKIANDTDGFKSALDAMKPKVDVFGTGNFVDRTAIKANHIIIERMAIGDGSIGYSYPYELRLNADKKYDKIKHPEGTSDVGYRIRLISFDINMDRVMNTILISALSTRKNIYGLNEDMTNMSESFDLFTAGTPADLSGKDFIERVYPYVVKDVIIQESENIIESNIEPIKTTDAPIFNPNKPDADILYPSASNDISIGSFSVVDAFLEFVQSLSAWKKFEVARMYAQETELLALKNLINGPSAINSGCEFIPYEGFYRSVSTDYIDTLFSPSDSEKFGLTNFCYMVFVTEAPSASLMELFGLVDDDNTTSFFIRGSNAIGIESKGNSDDLLSNVNLKVKPNTLYTLNRRDRYVLQLFEGDKIILELFQEPVFIPNGNIFDLNLSDQNGNPIGIGTVGGIAFSAAGPGLKGTEIKEMNVAIRYYLTRLGVLSS